MGRVIPSPPRAVTACPAAMFLAAFTSAFRSEAVRPTTFSSSPVDKAALTAMPRSIPAISALPGAGIGLGIDAKATCHRPALSRVTR